MQIVCPNCSASFNVGADALGASGRSVRCASCKQVWFAEAPAAVPFEDAPVAQLPTPAPAPPRATSSVPPPPVSAGPRSVGMTPAELARAQASDFGWESKPVAEDEAEREREFPDEAEAAEALAEEVAAGPEQDDVDAQGSDADLDADDALDHAAEEDSERDAEAEEQSADIDDAPSLVPDEEQPIGDAEFESEETEASGEAVPDKTPDYHEVRRRASVVAAKKRRDRPRVSAARMAAALVGTIFALGYARENIVRMLPQTASLYARLGMPVNLRGLVFEDIKTGSGMQDGVQVLIVEGAIRNVTNAPAEVPRLRFAMRNTAGIEIYSWTSLPDRAVLPPGEVQPFSTRLASPPADSREVFVRFFSRRDLASTIR